MSMENKTMGRQLEMFPRFLEGIPDYKERLAAFEYFQKYQRSTEEERMATFKSLRDKMNPPYYHEDGIARDVRSLNDFVEFPIASFERSDTPDNKGRYVYRVGYMNIDQVYEYAKKVLDKNGEILPSRQVRKAA